MKLNTLFFLILSICALQPLCLPQEDQKNLSSKEEELSVLAKRLIDTINLTKTSVRPPLYSQLFSKILLPQIILVESGSLIAHCLPFADAVHLPIYIQKNEVLLRNHEEITFIIAHEIGHKIAGMLPNGLSLYQITYQELPPGEVNGLNIAASCLCSTFGLMLFATGINSAKLLGNIPVNDNCAMGGLAIVIPFFFGLIKLGKHLFDHTHEQQIRHFAEIFCDTFAVLLTKNSQAGINWLRSKNNSISQCLEYFTINSHPSVVYRISNLERLQCYLDVYSYPEDIIAFAYEWTRGQFPTLQ